MSEDWEGSLTPSTTQITIEVPAGDGDGVYDVGKLSHDARFVRVRKDISGSYRRYTIRDGEFIVLRKV